MGIFGEYITPEGFRKLKTYQFKSSGYTFFDTLLNPWWEFVASHLPMWMAPNLVTMWGFICTWVALLMTLMYIPRLDEAAPRWVYFGFSVLLFLYQTLDAVDGKQARRTQTSSPLGQLFDHGCDCFSTCFLVFVTCGVARFGQGLVTYAILGILQMQLFVYTWWELHFHVFRCCTGATGVTEGQLVVILMSAGSFIFGPEIYITSIADLMPENIAWVMNSVGLGGLYLQCIVAAPFIVLLMYMLIVDLLEGYKKAPGSTALYQLAGFVAHVIIQYFFYTSGCVQIWPGWSYLLIVGNSSIYCLRMTVSATCKDKFYPVQWPVLPYYIAIVLIYIFQWIATSSFNMVVGEAAQSSSHSGRHPAIFYILCALSLWVTVYLVDFLTSTISSISRELQVSCFSISHTEDLWDERLFKSKKALRRTAAARDNTAKGSTNSSRKRL